MLEPREIPRLLAGWHPDRALTLAEHNAVHGELTGSVLRRGPELMDDVEASGLLGRGGAGFPAATKLRAVAGRRRTILLANGAEGEPASGKDACLLAYSPHLVLDGVSAAAAAIKADMAIVAVKENRPDALAAVEAAIAERSRVDRLQPVVVAVPADYVAGEESALVNFMNTGLALPTFTPPRPFERGVRGRPTLIQNVETLAHLALIARHGAAWYRALGPDDDPGSTLVTSTARWRRPASTRWSAARRWLADRDRGGLPRSDPGLPHRRLRRDLGRRGAGARPPPLPSADPESPGPRTGHPHRAPSR